MFSRRLPWVFLLILLSAGCGEMRPPGESRYFLRHRVQPGDTLYSIAWRFGYDHRQVAAWNNIKPPYRIYAGQELLIPEPGRGMPPEQRQEPPPKPPKEKTPTPTPTQAPRPPATVTAPEPVAPERAASRQNSEIQWLWPTTGKIVATFAEQKGRKGVDVSGKPGQPVIAAADGDVVYSGSGLVGYGNLIIIKHDDIYLSAYGHNRRLLVKEGDKVKRGVPIGEMGLAANGNAVLHFEIRRNGKPVNPLLYLPDKVF